MAPHRCSVSEGCGPPQPDQQGRRNRASLGWRQGRRNSSSPARRGSRQGCHRHIATAGSSYPTQWSGCCSSAEVVGAGKVEFYKSPRLAISGRCARLDVEACFPRALREDAVAARAGCALRDQIPWRSESREQSCCAALSGIASKLPVTPTVVVWLPFGGPPDEVVIEGLVDKPADADRSVGARDQERTRKAAA